MKIVDRRMLVVAVVLSLMLLGSFGLASLSFYWSHTGASQARLTLCQSQNEGSRALRSVLELARESSLGRARSPEDRQRLADFYRRALRQVPTIDCSHLSEGGKP